MQKLSGIFQEKQRVYLPGASGECAQLLEHLKNNPDIANGCHFISCPFPGINEIDLTTLGKDAGATVFLPPSSMITAIHEGRAKALPLSYSHIANWMEHSANIDLAIAHVSPPDHQGKCSLSLAADFTPLAWRSARRRLLIINPLLPSLPGPKISLADADHVLEIESALIEVASRNPDNLATTIGASIAELIPDNAHIQIGLGNAPAACWAHLSNHKNLTITSGLIADPAMGLFESGALNPSGHSAGVVLGTPPLHEFLAKEQNVDMVPVTVSHNVQRLGTLNKFFAVNGAIEIDLFGQVNLEWRGSKQISGVGGAPEFAAGAAVSPGGKSITALPSTARRGEISRIVSKLTCPVSLKRHEVDTVVTEFGVAKIRGLTGNQRAMALIDIAHPDFHDTLERDWVKLNES